MIRKVSINNNPYLVLLRVVCHRLQVSREELEGLVVVIWQLVQL